jgi:hypothetical protein
MKTRQKVKVLLVQLTKKLPAPHWGHKHPKGFIFPVVQFIEPGKVTVKAKAARKKYWHVLLGQYNISPIGILPYPLGKSAYLLLKKHCKIVGRYEINAKK